MQIPLKAKYTKHKPVSRYGSPSGDSTKRTHRKKKSIKFVPYDKNKHVLWVNAATGKSVMRHG